MCRLEAGWVNSGTADTNFGVCGLLEARGVDGGLVYTDFLTVCRLEAGSILAFSNINCSVVVVAVCSTTRTFDADIDVWEVREMRQMWSVEMRKLNVDVC